MKRSRGREVGVAFPQCVREISGGGLRRKVYAVLHLQLGQKKGQGGNKSSLLSINISKGVCNKIKLHRCRCWTLRRTFPRERAFNPHTPVCAPVGCSWHWAKVIIVIEGIFLQINRKKKKVTSSRKIAHSLSPLQLHRLLHLVSVAPAVVLG